MGRTRRSDLDQCAMGKHYFPTYSIKGDKQLLDEFSRWKCRTCGAWMWRAEVGYSEIEFMRRVKRRVKWETSRAQDIEARKVLEAKRAELMAAREQARKEREARAEEWRRQSELSAPAKRARSRRPRGVHS